MKFRVIVTSAGRRRSPKGNVSRRDSALELAARVGVGNRERDTTVSRSGHACWAALELHAGNGRVYSPKFFIMVHADPRFLGARCTRPSLPEMRFRPRIFPRTPEISNDCTQSIDKNSRERIARTIDESKARWVP